MGVRFLVVLTALAAGPGEDPAADRAAYEAERAHASADAGSQVRLALWCERHGMTAERMKHLAAAVLADPSHPLARGLMGLVARGGRWERPEDVSREVKADPKQKALMDEYLQRRARTADRVDDQWKLATWCEQVGLKQEAVAHYHAVLRLDPRREAAWKHLGFKKVGNRWVKPEWQEAAKREAEEQSRADRHWRPLLERWRSALSGRSKERRVEVEAALAEVTDPRAVPMVWAVFVPRGGQGEKTAVGLLGQIDSPGSSRALALLAFSGRSAEARARAVQILRQRDPRDFAPLLAAMIRDPIKYEVKSVASPGKPGELVIKDGTSSRTRLYTPPPSPSFVMGPNDYLSRDPSTGLPTITRYLGEYETTSMPSGTSSDARAWSMFGLNSPNLSPAGIAGLLEKAGLASSVSQQLGAKIAANLPGPTPIPGDPHAPIYYNIDYNAMIEIPIGEMMLESQRAAQVAGAQLANDVQAIERYNAPLREVNRRVRQVLAESVGNDLGDDRAAWAKWLADLFGYAYLPQKASAEESTVVEQVPLAFQMQAAPLLVEQPNGVTMFHHSCFGAGTPVRTLDGPRPIESIRAGDLVLTEDTRSGALDYRAVVEVYHNPPNATFRVALDEGGSIVSTGIHRLWKVGKGWAMVRELKPGDVLRTLGGVAAVKSIEADRTQPVYNLKGAEGESYFVGDSGVLAHDNSTIEPVPDPFDAVAPAPARSAPDRPNRPHSMLGR